jgi:hypothetical protein
MPLRKEERMRKLKYIGDGSFFPGVPAGDMTVGDDEAERLVASGLYAYAGGSKKAASVTETGDESESVTLEEAPPPE